MYANYNSDYSNNLGLRALELKAHGIDSTRNVCADLLNQPSNYYSTPTSSSEGYNECVWRIKFQETSTIFNDAETDPQMRAALAHRIIMEFVPGLIEENDKKFLSYICYAIVRGDIEALKKLLNGIARSFPNKLQAYVKTLNDILSDQGTGICFSFNSNDMILLHIYHGNYAIAINPMTASAVVLPIFTDWDGTVFFAEGEVLEPWPDELLAIIQMQCIRRILLRHEDYDKAIAANRLPIIHDESGSDDEPDSYMMIPELLTVQRNDLAA